MTAIALLRSINVGGHHRLPMATLRELCESLGWTDVRTVIQSGNVLFEPPTDAALSSGDLAARARLGAALADAVEARCGFRVPVILRAAEELEQTLADYPFTEAPEDQRHYVLAAHTPAEEVRLDPDRSPPERLQRVGDCVHLRRPKGTAKSKITTRWLEAQLGVAVTVRNHRTMQRILARV